MSKSSSEIFPQAERERLKLAVERFGDSVVPSARKVLACIEALEAENLELRESISPNRTADLSYYIGVAARMRAKETIIKPLAARSDTPRDASESAAEVGEFTDNCVGCGASFTWEAFCCCDNGCTLQAGVVIHQKGYCRKCCDAQWHVARTSALPESMMPVTSSKQSTDEEQLISACKSMAMACRLQNSEQVESTGAAIGAVRMIALEFMELKTNLAVLRLSKEEAERQRDEWRAKWNRLAESID